MSAEPATAVRAGFEQWLALDETVGRFSSDRDQLLQAAERHGWRLVLLGARSKVPVGESWQVTTDSADIGRHLERGGNIGLVCGPESGLMVLDFDDLDAAREMLESLGPLPLMVETGSGKRHGYFRHEAGMPAKLVWSGRTVGEVQRGPRQQIVAPPSTHPSGGHYRWIGDPADDLPLLPAEWRMYLAVPPRERGAPADSDLVARALGQPGAKLRSHGVKFACPKCRKDGHDKSMDNATLFLDGRWGCAFAPGDPEHRGAIGEAIGARGVFVRNDRGIVADSQDNVRLALDKLGAHLSQDLFARRMLLARDGHERPVDDEAMNRLWLDVDAMFRFRPSQSFFRTVVLDYCTRAPFHPVRDYLNERRWDGTPRVDQWLVDYAKADDSEYVRAVSQLVLIAAVRRVREPGCKFDELLILESGQGLDKSSALRTLCPRPEWFSDSLPLGADAKHTVEGTAGIWIAEAADLQSKSRGDIDQLKASLSRQVDGPVRLAYERLPVTVPRQFVVIGTTNKSTYLLDPTGNRRFWPVAVGAFDLDGLRRDRDQLWAEAAKREASGVSIRLPRELWPKAEQEQEARRVEDPWEEVLAERLGDAAGKLLSDAAWQIVGLPVERRTQADNERFGAVMKRLGFQRKKLRHGKEVSNGYARGAEDTWLIEPLSEVM